MTQPSALKLLVNRDITDLAAAALEARGESHEEWVHNTAADIIREHAAHPAWLEVAALAYVESVIEQAFDTHAAS